MEEVTPSAGENELVPTLTPTQALVALSLFIFIFVLWRARRAK